MLWHSGELHILAPLALLFFAPRRGIVCLWKEISYIWYPDATLIKQNAHGTAGDNRVNCNRIPRAAVYDILPAPPGDSAGQKIALIATGLYTRCVCESPRKPMATPLNKRHDNVVRYTHFKQHKYIIPENGLIRLMFRILGLKNPGKRILTNSFF